MSLSKPGILIPLYVIAACSGILLSLYKHRHMRVAGAQPPREVSRRRPGPVVPEKVAAEGKVVVSLSPPMSVARLADLAVYSKFNFVARRTETIPAVFDRTPGEIFRWGEDIRTANGLPPSYSFRLMFPDAASSGEAGATVAYTPKELAMAVYAETRGLFPARAEAGSVYNPGHWETGFGPGAFGDLTLARRMIAETRKRNKRTHLAYFPPDANRHALLAWYCCTEAAEATVGATLYPLPPGMRLHFFIRQSTVGRQKADYLAGRAPVMSFGPFVNVGGGDVPRGASTCIDFYVLPASRR